MSLSTDLGNNSSHEFTGTNIMLLIIQNIVKIKIHGPSPTTADIREVSVSLFSGNNTITKPLEQILTQRPRNIATKN